MTLLSGILLVDDDSTTNYLNKILLLRLGVTERLLVAESGREAPRTAGQNGHGCRPAVPCLDSTGPEHARDGRP
ncbi:MAG: hypothetical protein ACRYFZ_14345 [Janthinobacterium lividum]